jgi:hypothetical protein
MSLLRGHFSIQNTMGKGQKGHVSAICPFFKRDVSFFDVSLEKCHTSEATPNCKGGWEIQCFSWVLYFLE